MVHGARARSVSNSAMPKLASWSHPSGEVDSTNGSAWFGTLSLLFAMALLAWRSQADYMQASMLSSYMWGFFNFHSVASDGSFGSCHFVMCHSCWEFGACGAAWRAWRPCTEPTIGDPDRKYKISYTYACICVCTYVCMYVI